ncbi:MAG: hypothetical protein FWC51_04480 [Proteobacteria bacterium]|nr:hypothetical protein [Pseudomonadota bacterium]
MISTDEWHHLPCGAHLPQTTRLSDVIPHSPVPFDEYAAVHSMMTDAARHHVAAAVLYHKIAGIPECGRLAELCAIHHNH